MFNTLERHQFIFTDLSHISRTIHQSHHILADKAEEFCPIRKKCKNICHIQGNDLLNEVLQYMQHKHSPLFPLKNSVSISKDHTQVMQSVYESSFVSLRLHFTLVWPTLSPHPPSTFLLNPCQPPDSPPPASPPFPVLLHLTSVTLLPHRWIRCRGVVPVELMLCNMRSRVAGANKNMCLTIWNALQRPFKRIKGLQ